MLIARRAIVHGHVQGVGFRAACHRRAAEAGVSGWVRNTPDGTVEVHLEAEGDAVRRLLAWLDEGPRLARVTAVTVTAVDREHVTGFSVR